MMTGVFGKGAARLASRAVKGGIVALTLTEFRRFWSTYVE